MKSWRVNDMKEFNRRKVIQAVQSGVCSRADVASALGLSKPAVSALVEELIAEGWVQEAGFGTSTGAGGKKPILLKFNYGVKLIAAAYFNLHLQELELAVTDLAGAIMQSSRHKLPVQSDYTLTLGELAQQVKAAASALEKDGDNRCLYAFSLAVSGIVDTESGILRYSSAAPDWQDIPIRSYMREALGMPVFVENDARASAMTELLHGEGKEIHTFACIQVGQGIGTGVVIGGKPFRGSSYGAVTFAHTTICDDGPVCRCGNRGCWETVASLGACLKELIRREKTYESMPFDRVLERYSAGEPLVVEVMHRYTAYWLGAGIANLLNSFNPELVVIQGELTEAGPAFLDHVRQTALARAIPAARQVRLTYSSIRSHVQLKGAAAVVSQSLFSV